MSSIKSLVGLVFCFTGELKTMSRSDVVDTVKFLGGGVVAHPSSDTDHVVLGVKPGLSKLRVTKNLGVSTLDEKQFLRILVDCSLGRGLDDNILTKLEVGLIQYDSVAFDGHEETSAVANRSEPASRLWTMRHAPRSLGEICGNQSHIEKLQQWLRHWPSNLKSAFKQPGQYGMALFRAVLITGPPGIGKTMAAHMVAHVEGYTAVEFNASDTRSKKLVENALNVTNMSLDVFLGGSRDDSVPAGRTMIIMDEVDGMSAGDPGGIGALNSLIKKTKVPIICIANDRAAQKLKPLLSTTFSLPFQRPSVQAIRLRLMDITLRERMTIPASVAEQIVRDSQCDVRQVLNMLSFWRLSNRRMTSEEGKELPVGFSAKMNEKSKIMSPFDITAKLLGPYLFSSTALESLGEKMDYYFQDHFFVPLFMQENYLKTEATQLQRCDGPVQQQLKSLELMDAAASSMSDGDLVDAFIHGSEQHWSLMPFHSICSTVRPAFLQHGVISGRPSNNSPLSFPQWFGHNSKQMRLSRNLDDIHTRMRLQAMADKVDIRQWYIPALFPYLVRPLIDVGSNAVGQVIEKLDVYYLSRDSWDTIVELGVDTKREAIVLKQISSATKTSFTKRYKALRHPISFHRASDPGVMSQQVAGSNVPDIEEAFDVSIDHGLACGS
ncbi:replication factor RFC1 C terminal domain-containing protein [Mycena galericulata]|nr:replication factor RFC1 C terminal domain-containing protein [Mycena galericulata]